MSERKAYFGKEEVKPMQDYTYPIPFDQGKEDWNELKSFLSRQKYIVLCSKRGFDNFVEETIRTGNVGLFKFSLQKFARNWPRKAYHLTDSGNLNVATFVKN